MPLEGFYSDGYNFCKCQAILSDRRDWGENLGGHKCTSLHDRVNLTCKDDN